MTFEPGDRVHLERIGTGLIVERRGQNRYAVEIKGRIVVVAADDLELAKKPQAERGANVSHEQHEADPQPRPTPSVDLHGRTVHDAVEAVESFINDALLAGHAEVRIVHGRSGGRVKQAVHRYLGALPTVKSFRVDPRNPGVTLVMF